MQNTEEIFEIDLSECKASEEIVDKVVLSLDGLNKKNQNIKLKLEDVQINQAQMVFIKSLINSYGQNLDFVQTSNQVTKDICKEIGVKTVDFIQNTNLDIQDIELNSLREEFKKEEIENGDFKKQVIGVYRKADEEENNSEFQNENVDFYATPTDEPVVIDTKQTIYVNQTLRSGQILEYDGNVVIIGDCHPGSEIRATGDITVWGVLGGIAHAGSKGNVEARVRALKMNAVQLRIADCYSRRPDGGNIPYIVKSSVFVPEEARIVDNNIVLFKMAQN